MPRIHGQAKGGYAASGARRLREEVWMENL